MTFYNFAYIRTSLLGISLGMMILGIGAGVIVFQQYSHESEPLISFLGGLLWVIGAITIGIGIYKCWSNKSKQDTLRELR